LCNWNDSNLKSSRRINWRASLVPAAAVIPAPKGYINVVAVKKLVVEFRGGYFVFRLGWSNLVLVGPPLFLWAHVWFG